MHQCFISPIIFELVLAMISIKDWMAPSVSSLDDALGGSVLTLEGPSLSPLPP